MITEEWRVGEKKNTRRDKDDKKRKPRDEKRRQQTGSMQRLEEKRKKGKSRTDPIRSNTKKKAEKSRKGKRREKNGEKIRPHALKTCHLNSGLLGVGRRGDTLKPRVWSPVLFCCAAHYLDEDVLPPLSSHLFGGCLLCLLSAVLFSYPG